MRLQKLQHLPLIEILPGFRGRFVHSAHMTFAFWEIDADFELPEHSHPNEQVSHMLEGVFELQINGEARQLHPGEIAIIPGNTTHSGKAITACRILDVFYPRREDYIFNG